MYSAPDGRGRDDLSLASSSQVRAGFQQDVITQLNLRAHTSDSEASLPFDCISSSQGSLDTALPAATFVTARGEQNNCGPHPESEATPLRGAENSSSVENQYSIAKGCRRLQPALLPGGLCYAHSTWTHSNPPRATRSVATVVARARQTTTSSITAPSNGDTGDSAADASIPK